MSNKSHNLFDAKTIGSVVIIMLLALVSFFKLGSENDTSGGRDMDLPKNASYYDVSNVRYKDKKLVLTKHAKCRMGCREIDAYEVGQILANGVINKRKSSPDAKPCPKYSLEGRSRDGQTVRAVIADCNDVVKLVTVIDLDNDYNCTCK